jgi:hypothetical protein
VPRPDRLHQTIRSCRAIASQRLRDTALTGDLALHLGPVPDPLGNPGAFTIAQRVVNEPRDYSGLLFVRFRGEWHYVVSSYESVQPGRRA